MLEPRKLRKPKNLKKNFFKTYVFPALRQTHVQYNFRPAILVAQPDELKATLWLWSIKRDSLYLSVTLSHLD